MTVRAKRLCRIRPFAIELQEDGMRQPIDMGIQAANARCSTARANRNYTVRQVNTVAAALRLAIECAAGPHIRAYVVNGRSRLVHNILCAAVVN